VANFVKGAHDATVGNMGGGGSSDVADGGVGAGLHLWRLGYNTALTELNLTDAGFLRLNYFSVTGNVNMTRVSLKNMVVNQTSFATLLAVGF
jgi:hypothetical protein